jgi:hypothetical protein
MNPHNAIRSTVALLGVIVVLVSACSGPPEAEGEVAGVVTEVTGDLSGVESFVVLDVDGDSYKFVPRSGLEVMGNPPSHLRDHVVSGDPVIVTYHEDALGVLVADEVSGPMSAEG